MHNLHSVWGVCETGENGKWTGRALGPRRFRTGVGLSGSRVSFAGWRGGHPKSAGPPGAGWLTRVHGLVCRGSGLRYAASPKEAGCRAGIRHLLEARWLRVPCARSEDRAGGSRSGRRQGSGRRVCRRNRRGTQSIVTGEWRGCPQGPAFRLPRSDHHSDALPQGCSRNGKIVRQRISRICAPGLWPEGNKHGAHRWAAAKASAATWDAASR